MPNIYSIKLPSFVYWVIGVFVLIIVLIFVGIFVSKKLQEKRKKDCFNILNKICQKKVKDNYKLELVNNNLAYDYFIETENYKYYIKLINNPNNQEICVNNAIKWQLRSGPHDKEMRFVEGVEHLMRMDIKRDQKISRKVFIIYPNSKALFKVINECEMIFVNPDTDIYGANIITYKQLEDNYNLIEL